MIKDIAAKTLLSSTKRPDPWFGIKYTMNLYRGCSHQCIYYTQLDWLFPGLRKHYKQRFGDRYSTPANDAHQLEQISRKQCERYGITTRMRLYEAPAPLQPALL